MDTQKDKPLKEYIFRYIPGPKKTFLLYIRIRATHMEEAHQKGKEQALKRYPDAHAFCTEPFGE